MLSAKCLTDLLLFPDIFRKTPSAFNKISIVKSSLPFPLSTLATLFYFVNLTAFIFEKIFVNLDLK